MVPDQPAGPIGEHLVVDCKDGSLELWVAREEENLMSVSEASRACRNITRSLRIGRIVSGRSSRHAARSTRAGPVTTLGSSSVEPQGAQILGVRIWGSADGCHAELEALCGDVEDAGREEVRVLLFVDIMDVLRSIQPRTSCFTGVFVSATTSGSPVDVVNDVKATNFNRTRDPDLVGYGEAVVVEDLEVDQPSGVRARRR